MMPVAQYVYTGTHNELEPSILQRQEDFMACAFTPYVLRRQLPD